MTGAMLVTGKRNARSIGWECNLGIFAPKLGLDLVLGALNKVFGFDATVACRKPSFGSSGRIAESLSP